MSLVAGRQQFLGRDMADSRAQRANVSNRFIDFLLATWRFRHDPRDRPTAAGNHNGLAALDIIQDLRQASLGVGNLNLAHF